MAGQLSNPFGVMGLPKSWDERAPEYQAGGAIAKDTVVSWQTNGSVITATTSVITNLVAGVAKNDAATGETVRVCQSGLTYVKGDGSIIAGSSLIRSTSVAGNVTIATAQTGTSAGVGGVIGVAVQALSADKSGYVLAYINPTVLKTA